MRAPGLLAVWVLLLSWVPAATTEPRTMACDIIVAGGSTAALAASLNAAKNAPEKEVCLIEPTDWPGGQMTSSAVSAIDFGVANSLKVNQPRDFVEMLASLGPGNPGYCWVSRICYQPLDLLKEWIWPTIANLTNLRVFYNTVMKAVQTDGANRIQSLLTIHRTPRIPFSGYKRRLSEDIEDWYDPRNSSRFIKQEILFVGRSDLDHTIFIETTEFGEVLVLSGAPYMQGIEIPTEDSFTTDDTCGQRFVFPYYVSVDQSLVVPQRLPPPPPFANYTLSRFTWGRIWSYRRSKATLGPQDEARIGEVDNQNWGPPGGNDYGSSYLWLSDEQSQNQVADWKGGVNVSALAEAELLAYGWFTYYRKTCPDAPIADRLYLNGSIAGTETGLSKVPYIRDTRRSIGIEDFRLMYEDLKGDNSSQTGTVFPDRVALGDYLYADMHRMRDPPCPTPSYLTEKDIKPYYVPFRALTNKKFTNLLVAGKTMAQTFHANSGTRLHPVEWTTGLAAGIAATMMARQGITTEDLYLYQVAELQELLIANKAPIEWTLP